MATFSWQLVDRSSFDVPLYKFVIADLCWHKILWIPPVPEFPGMRQEWIWWRSDPPGQMRLQSTKRTGRIKAGNRIFFFAFLLLIFPQKKRVLFTLNQVAKPTVFIGLLLSKKHVKWRENIRTSFPGHSFLFWKREVWMKVRDPLVFAKILTSKDRGLWDRKGLNHVRSSTRKTHYQSLRENVRMFPLFSDRTQIFQPKLWHATLKNSKILFCEQVYIHK